MLAMLFACWLTLGSDPMRVCWIGGIDALVLTRRLQGLLLALSVLPALALLGLVVVRFASPAWVVALLPSMLLLVVHVSRPPMPRVSALSLSDLPDPPAEVAPEEMVLGFVLGDRSVAVPLSRLVESPAMLVSDRDRRVLLAWNPSAQRALVIPVGLEVKSADLEIVGEVEGSLLLYNRRFGQFLVGMTGLSSDGSRPIGVMTAHPPNRLSWSAWRRRHPRSLLVPGGTSPWVPTKPSDAVAVIHTPTPVAVPTGLLASESIRNTEIEGTSVLLVRDDAGIVRCFNRRLAEDLFLRLRPLHDPRTGRDVLFDPGSQSQWSLDGIGLDGEMKGSRLREYVIEPAVSRAALQRWQPDIRLIDLP